MSLSKWAEERRYLTLKLSSSSFPTHSLPPAHLLLAIQPDPEEPHTVSSDPDNNNVLSPFTTAYTCSFLLSKGCIFDAVASLSSLLTEHSNCPTLEHLMSRVL